MAMFTEWFTEEGFYTFTIIEKTPFYLIQYLPIVLIRYLPFFLLQLMKKILFLNLGTR